MSRGGLLLDEIRDALGWNEKLIAQFTLLLDGAQFTDEAIIKALAYFIKVFSHLRAKDVALKYNSNLNGSNTVRLRQTLAGGLAMGNKQQKEGIMEEEEEYNNLSRSRHIKPQQYRTESKYKLKFVPELKDICRARGLPVSVG